MTASVPPTAQDRQVDPRGVRFGAAVTLLFALIAVLAGNTAVGLIATAVLVVLFLPGAFIGPQATVQSFLFTRLVRPRLDAPTETESFRPPRFAQQMGLGMSAAALILGLIGGGGGFYFFIAMVVIASFLNAVFNFCMGCELYLAFKRATTRAA
ncbi:DUF4395 domain-containing protein [Demequina sp. B12]|uniref:DUF4395 domain-containing protein n=1 Tax=Demequina sp. B12 TaxID=2992757 RepID=UPI00237AA846|nr:DUF4395 domain-containing protein [Demequina sp. B12]MDE0572256.1 DUF4395 domain-containing protein [Demequina sp. B12]